jgi:3-hydroxymyristoyl/3-hydroxydecanoyl-(acyl carrier protein) dehydratase
MASFEKVVAEEKEITLFIPQKQPMVMIGRLLSVVDKKTITSLLISEENIFCEDGFLKEPGLIENMAQTAAAGASYLSQHVQKEPAVGFIGAIKNLKIHAFPPVGSEIITEVTVEHEVFDATVVSGKVFLDERVIAECELKIFIQKQ